MIGIHWRNSDHRWLYSLEEEELEIGDRGTLTLLLLFHLLRTKTQVQ